MSDVLSGAEFKKQLREGKPKFGLFINSHSPTVVEQLAFKANITEAEASHHNRNERGTPQLSSMSREGIVIDLSPHTR